MVAVTVAPVVPLDLLCASGTSYFGEPALPYVPGVQGVGRVVRSPALEPGTRVWFATSAGMAPGDGSLAETCAVVADDERRALVEQDHVALFGMGAHPFLTLTLFIALFERDHGPLEYQLAYGAAMKHLTLPYPDIST